MYQYGKKTSTHSGGTSEFPASHLEFTNKNYTSIHQMQPKQRNTTAQQGTDLVVNLPPSTPEGLTMRRLYMKG